MPERTMTTRCCHLVSHFEYILDGRSDGHQTDALRLAPVAASRINRSLEVAIQRLDKLANQRDQSESF